MNSAQLKKILSTKQWNFNITRVEAEMIRMIKIREKTTNMKVRLNDNNDVLQ